MVLAFTPALRAVSATDQPLAVIAFARFFPYPITVSPILKISNQKLILENQVVLEELDMECQEKINEDIAYALSYLSIYNNQLNVPKMHREMNNLMIIYGLGI
ncbi:hypothetical protein DXA98_14645 [Lachnospiraceae bacterium OF09-6]|nr:hypothetical protein DXA98_14645 [Lachnospiraceae bacterium OF09-6]